MRRILAVAAVVTATLALSAPAEASTDHTTEPSASELAHLASIADSHTNNGWQSCVSAWLKNHETSTQLRRWLGESVSELLKSSATYGVLAKANRACATATLPAPKAATTTTTAPPTTAAPTTVTTSPPTTAAPAAPTSSCSPVASSGNCYQAGEYCPNADHGMSGTTASGEAIICEDNNGWRWEPS